MLDLHVQLHRTNELLERIAVALERAVGPAYPGGEPGYKKRGREAILNYGDTNKLWLRENFQNLVHEKGLAPAQERELLEQAMKEYDQSLEDEAMEEEPE